MCLIVARKLADPDPKITTIAVAPAFSLSWWSILFLFLTTVQPRSFLPTFVHLLVIFLLFWPLSFWRFCSLFNIVIVRGRKVEVFLATNSGQTLPSLLSGFRLRKEEGARFLRPGLLHQRLNLHYWFCNRILQFFLSIDLLLFFSLFSSLSYLPSRFHIRSLITFVDNGHLVHCLGWRIAHHLITNETAGQSGTGESSI